ncbi:MAG: hypothetical protein AMJ61_07090 [Desulfobacterales bacterium SG8_35_2]|jgi:hypothetical protein|nr:MAG: hypothetical protein AMJ61_07090 [Desulfobacterales bacterium SG8_35_2]
MRGKGENGGEHWNAVKSVLTGLCALLVFVLAAGLALPGNASAEEGYGPGQDRWKFALGGFFPSIDSQLKIDGSEVGNIVDLDILGFSDNENIFRLDGYWRFFTRHRLEFGYYRFNTDGSRRLDEEIRIGDEIFEVGFLTSSELDIGFYTIDYMYSFYQGEKWELSGGLGVYWVDLSFSIAASLDINNNVVTGVAETTDFDGPLPFLALSFEYYITPKWLAIVNGGYFQLEVGDIDGRLTNLGAKLEYQFTKTFGLGVGYDFFDIDVDVVDGNLRSNIVYNFRGVQAYGILRF